MKIWNVRSHNEVNISNDKVELYEKILSVKLLVIVIIDFKRCVQVQCKVNVSYVATFKLKYIYQN